LSVIRGRVLVIDGDEWIGPLLARALREKGFEADVCGEAREGFTKACATMPDCVVCSFELPDIDGYWVARRLRTEAGSMARTPVIMLGELNDQATRAQAFAAGADVVLARPVSNDDVVAQIEALVAMSRRYGADDSGGPSSTSVAAAIRGDLSMFPLASVLMMFELERRSGLIDVVSSGGTRAVLTIAHGLFATTELAGDAKPAIEVLRAVLSWRAGRFSFVSRDPENMPPPRDSVGALVLEAMRLEDEKNNEPVVPTIPKAGLPMRDPFPSDPPPARKSLAPKRSSVAPPKRNSVAPGRRSMPPPAKNSKAPPAKDSVKPPSAPKAPDPKRPATPKSPA
jgi:CheY-like chemotaxis protein